MWGDPLKTMGEERAGLTVGAWFAKSTYKSLALSYQTIQLVMRTPTTQRQSSRFAMQSVPYGNKLISLSRVMLLCSTCLVCLAMSGLSSMPIISYTLCLRGTHV